MSFIKFTDEKLGEFSWTPPENLKKLMENWPAEGRKDIEQFVSFTAKLYISCLASALAAGQQPMFDMLENMKVHLRACLEENTVTLRKAMADDAGKN